ncbi:serine/threonine-protein kinase [Vulgatibacter sp.]|uniref:serine/threonine-protein kinase n=1 Tax=Vulgatibacter sp. TaxID=1971226 RepID=UPI0035639523
MRLCPRCGGSYGSDAAYCTRDGTRLGPADAVDERTLLVGQQGLVLGSYRLVELIGEGGMGRVYLAEHTRLGRKVALKMLKPELASNPQAVKRFFAEARAVNLLAHENVVEITDFFEGEAPEDPKFFIMELLRGQSLRQLLEHEGALPAVRAAHVGAQLASALGAVHGAGIVHRDLKPDNVFLTERGGVRDFVKLLDFGIARHLDPEPGISMARTAAGAVVGTPEYMAPEQASGSDTVDHRADVYALGVILYELATGVQPIKGKTFGETLVRQLTFTPPPPGAGLPSGLPQPFESLVMACLAKAPAERPTVVEVEAGLRALLEAPAEQRATTPRPAGSATLLDAAGAVAAGSAPATATAAQPTNAEAQARRSARVLVAAAAACLALLAGIAAWWILRETAPAPAAPQPPAAAERGGRPASPPPAATTPSPQEQQRRRPPAPASGKAPRPTEQQPRPL